MTGGACWRMPNPLFRRRQLYEHDAVRRDVRFVLVLELAQVLLPPQVADDLLAAHLRVFELSDDRHRLVAEVEQSDRTRAVFEFLRPHLTARVVLALRVA